MASGGDEGCNEGDEATLPSSPHLHNSYLLPSSIRRSQLCSNTHPHSKTEQDSRKEKFWVITLHRLSATQLHLELFLGVLRGSLSMFSLSRDGCMCPVSFAGCCSKQR